MSVGVLKSIPHLKLPVTFEVESLVEEVMAARDKFVGYELPGEERDEVRESYRENWTGFGLVDYEPDSSKGMLDARSYQGQPPPLNIERTVDGRAIMHETEMAEKMPHCMSIIRKLFQFPGRCRIASMKAGGSLNWHSHCQFKSGNYDEHDAYDLAIVHVPITTNTEVEFGVTKFHHGEHGVHPVWQHYEAGSTWLLNSWHEHNIRNSGTEDRIHLMMYGSLRDPRLIPHIFRALQSYNGPYIE